MKIIRMIPLILIVSMVYLTSAPVQVASLETCNTPTETVTITSPLIENRFDKTEIAFSKNTCVELIFVNDQPESTLTPHDFVVDSADGLTGGINLKPAGGGTESITFMTPDKDITYEFYCAVPTHREIGMEGELIIGAGSSTEDDNPGFGLMLSFIALSAMLVTLLRRRR
ncbi:MAG: cupredoxin domain-containing protein [Candidatus Heimdallarchaeota archaeon]|nr:cupredoxin domain-containing protein [Candidatus Heimdallarchaeota archaeon]